MKEETKYYKTLEIPLTKEEWVDIVAGARRFIHPREEIEHFTDKQLEGSLAMIAKAMLYFVEPERAKLLRDHCLYPLIIEFHIKEWGSIVEGVRKVHPELKDYSDKQVTKFVEETVYGHLLHTMSIFQVKRSNVLNKRVKPDVSRIRF